MPARLIDGFATTDVLADVFSDEAVVAAMLRFEVALSQAQARLGMIPFSAADAIAKVSPPDAASIAADARLSASLAIPFVKALGADFVHFGVTSQDLLDTTLVLLLRNAHEILARDHALLEAKLRELSDRHAGTVMLARTLLQPAPPITFGYKAACWFGGVHRSWRRLSAAFGEAVQLQFGGASGTLAAYGTRGPELAAELGRELELPVPCAPWHTQRDRLAAVVAHCGVYTGSVVKISRDVSLLMQAEIGEVSEAGGGSSAMPNKRNPAGSVVALAAAAALPGLVATYLAAMPQEHERAAGGWQSEWPTVARAVQATGSALAATVETVSGLTVNADRMRRNIEALHGAVFAEKAAMLLSAQHGDAGARKLVAKALQGKNLQEGLAPLLTPEQLQTLDRPEDCLGAAETYRRRLLKDVE